MMRIQVTGRVLGIVFSHPQEKKLKRKLNGKKAHPRFTHCEIYEVGEKDLTIISEGVQPCSVDDCFQKEKGRKRALARAFAKLKGTRKEIDKIDRILVWKAYHARHGVPTPKDEVKG